MMNKIHCFLLIALLSAFSQAQTPTPAPAIAPDPSAEEPIVKAVARALPAVVNINTEKVVTRTVQQPGDEIFERFFGAPNSGYGRRVQQRVRSLGSGFFVSAEGYIITNEHVVERADKLKISVTTFDGKTYQGKHVYGDSDRDLALIQIVGGEAQPWIDINLISPNHMGQTVIALGNPIGYQSSVSAGILSGKDRTVGNFTGLLQTDAAINPGNSGGPLIDLAGRLAGVNSIKVSFAGNGQNGSPPPAAENIGFAIPGEIVRDWATDAIAIAKGEKQPPAPVDPVAILKDRLGLQLQDLTPDLAQTLGYGMLNGVLISGIDAGSPAEKAGILPGMVLQAVIPYATPELALVPKEIGKLKKGNSVDLVVVRPVRRGNVLFQQSAKVRVVAR